jgi:hypothetical protein
MLCREVAAPLVPTRLATETEMHEVLAGFGVTGRQLERAPCMGAAIEMPAAVAALRVEVGDELCERAVVQVVATPSRVRMRRGSSPPLSSWLKQFIGPSRGRGGGGEPLAAE